MPKLKVISENEKPEPKPESFKSWKENEKPAKKKTTAKKTPAKRGRPKHIYTEAEIKELETLKEKVDERQAAIEANQKAVKKKLGLAPDASIPNKWLKGGTKLDMDNMHRFCELYKENSLISKCAQTLGINTQTVYKAIKSNPIFAEMVEEAKAHYRDKIVETVYKRAVEGVDEPIIGGMARDQIVAYKRNYSDRLLELEAKRVEHGYRDKGGVEINTGGGVMVVNAGNLDERSWEEKYGAIVQEDS